MAIPRTARAQVLAREVSDPAVWLLTPDGTRYWVPNPTELSAWTPSTPFVLVPSGSLAGKPTIPPDGTLVVERGSGAVRVVLGGGTFDVLSDPTFFAQHGGQSSVVTIPRGSLFAVPPGSGLSTATHGARTNTMIRERSKAPVWFVHDEIGYWVSDFGELAALGGWSAVTTIPDQDGRPAQICPANGTLLQERTQAPVWVVFGCTRYWVSDPIELFAIGGWSQVVTVPNRGVTEAPPGYPVPVNARPPDGAILVERTTSAPFLIAYSAKFAISPSEAPFFITSATPSQVVPFRALTSAPAGFNPVSNVPREGGMIRERSGTTTFVFYGGQMFIATNPNECPEYTAVVPNGSIQFTVSPTDQFRAIQCPGLIP